MTVNFQTAAASSLASFPGPRDLEAVIGQLIFFNAKAIHDGNPTDEDLLGLKQQYLRAARLGNVNAKVNLGYMYFVGEGGPQDYKISFSWYLDAAKSGDADAYANLALMYEHGFGVRKNKENAARLAQLSKQMRKRKAAKDERALQSLRQETTKIVGVRPIMPANVKYTQVLPIRMPDWFIYAISLFLFLAIAASAMIFSRAWFGIRDRKNKHDFIRDFCAQNMDVVRTSYLRFPEQDRKASSFVDRWSTLLCVLLVKHGLARTGVPHLDRLSVKIKLALEKGPKTARMAVYPMVAGIQMQLKKNLLSLEDQSVYLKAAANDQSTGLPLTNGHALNSSQLEIDSLRSIASQDRADASIPENLFSS